MRSVQGWFEYLLVLGGSLSPQPPSAYAPVPPHPHPGRAMWGPTPNGDPRQS